MKSLMVRAEGWVLTCTLAGLMACGNGCIIVPIPTRDHTVMAGHEPSTNAIAEIRTNITDKVTVLERLGPPAAIWQDENLFLYWWQAHWGKVYWLFAIGAAGGGVGAAGNSGSVEAARTYALYVKFDDNDRVQRVERMPAPWNGIGQHAQKWVEADGHRLRVAKPPASSHQKTRLVFRIVATAHGKPLCDAVRSSRLFSSRALVAGLGSFHSGGAPFKRSPHHLDSGPSDGHWFYYDLEPGTYYVGLAEFGSFRRSQRENAERLQPGDPIDSGLILRADIPGEAEVVYGGTVHLECSVFERATTSVNPWLARVEDEHTSIPTGVAVLKPGATIVTQLMKVHSGPYILSNSGVTPRASLR